MTFKRVSVRGHYRLTHGKRVTVRRHTRNVHTTAATALRPRRARGVPKTTFEQNMPHERATGRRVNLSRINEDGPRRVYGAGAVDSDAYEAAVTIYRERAVYDEDENFALSDEEVRRANADAWDAARAAIVKKTGSPKFGDRRNIVINNAAIAANDRAQQDAG